MEDGSQDPQRGEIAPQGPALRTVAPTVPHGTLMVVLGGICALFIPFAAILLMAYGMRELMEEKGGRGAGLAFLEGAALSVISLTSDLASAMLLASIVVVCFGIACCMWRGATVTNVSVAVLVAALASFGADAVLAASAGLPPNANAVSYLTEGLSASFGKGIEGEMLVRQLGQLVDLLWPFIYVSASAFDALLAGIGSLLMRSRVTGQAKPASLSRFDAPMWSIGVFSIALVCLGASFTGFPEAGILRTASVTALMGVRIIFALQGFAVMSALMIRKRMGCMTRAVCIFIIFWSEMMFFIMSIIGLIDVWANFRKLARDGSDASGLQ